MKHNLTTVAIAAALSALGLNAAWGAGATLVPNGMQCFAATAPTSGGQAGTGTGMVGLLGTIQPGSGGTGNGNFGGVALQGGAGTGATANINVVSGRVASVTVLNPGSSYQVGDVLTARSQDIGGVVGFQVPVSSVAINQGLAGGSVWMFIPNTTTVKQTWKDAAQTQLNTNPITLDANGCATIYGTGTYRQVLTDRLQNIIWDKPTTDTSVQSVQWAGTASNASTPNLGVLNDPGFNATDGSIISFIPTQTNTGAFAVSFQSTSYSNIPVVLDMISGPQPLQGGEIVPNNIVVMIYSASENTFHLVNSAQAASLDLLANQVNILQAQFNQQPTSQEFTAGTGTYTPTVAPTPPGATMPPVVLYIKVRMVGGGGGGAGTGAPGSGGGTTSFGGWSAVGGAPGTAPSGANSGAGGAGGSGGASGTGTQNGRWPGGSGSSSGSVSGLTGGSVVFAGGPGGASCFGGNGGSNNRPSGTNTGGGGGGADGGADLGGTAGGGAGECVEFTIANPTAQAYNVGVGGGSGGANAGTGATGYITVEEFYH